MNIVKNAIESIEARLAAAKGAESPRGEIVVSIREEDGRICVAIEDNGKGLPRQGRERLTEPYVTTRAKGTGLGLAIVKKIMEDHLGELALEDRQPMGARVSLIFYADARAAVRSGSPGTVSDAASELSTLTHGA